MHGVSSQLCPAVTHVPQLGLQHTSPTLHVFCPHIVLVATSAARKRGAHGVSSQLCPAATHVPQLALQHTSPTLHVFCPHIALTVSSGV